MVVFVLNYNNKTTLMSINKINPRTSVIALFIIIVAGIRLLGASTAQTAFTNFTPIGAMALFGGAYFSSNQKAFLFPLLALFASDVIMMQVFYKTHTNGLLYSGWYWTYGAFVVMVLIGRFIQNISVKNVVVAAVAGALAHWIITDFGVWASGGTCVTTGQPFTKDFSGFAQCLYVAIPFMKNMLLGNLIYGALMFGGFELLQKRYPILKLQTA
jgi:hypothetical protein